MDRIIMHIDVNNAFLSWTAIDLLNHGNKYDIRNSYAVIGGDPKMRHGIVLAKSMPAKKLGIVTAETLFSAKKKCKSLRVYPPNYSWYSYMSKELFKLISKYSPDIEIASIDECYLDYTKVRKLNGDPIKFAYKLKKEVKDKLGFTINIGIANNKLCAKMASDFSKPDKVHTLFMNEVKNKMWPLPIEDLFGVGKSSSKKLRKLGVNTIRDLACYNPEKLYLYFKNQSKRMIDAANGIDNTQVQVINNIRKGISNSITLSRDLTDIVEINNIVAKLAENVASCLRKQKQYTYVVGVILKDNYFKSYSHQRKLKNPTNITSEIVKVAKELVKEMWHEESIRLIGVRLDKLVKTPYHQVSLFENFDNKKKENKLDTTIDNLRKKYGNNIVGNANKVDKNIYKKY